MKKVSVSILGFTFVIGILIFFFGHGWIRNYGGDAIAIVFLYCLLGICTQRSILQKMATIFILALGVECIPLWIGSSTNPLQQFFLGSTFDLKDIFIYFVTIIGAGSTEYALRKMKCV